MRFFNRFSIKHQFYFIASILMLICIMLIGLVNYTIKNLLISQQLTYTKSTLAKFESEITSLYERVLIIYDFLQFESNIEDIFIDPFTPQMLYYLDFCKKNFSTLSIMNSDLVDISLIGNGIYYSGLFNAQTLDTLAEQSILDSTINSLGIMQTNFRNKTPTPYCIFSKNIYSFTYSNHYGEKLGTLILAIDPSKSIRLPSDADTLNTSFMLIDKNFTVYPINDQSALESEDFNSFLHTLSTSSIEDYAEIDTPHYIFSVSHLPNIGYSLVSAIHKDNITSTLQSTRILMNLVLMIILIFTGFIVIILFHNVMAPLNHLYLFIKSIGEGNRKNLKQPLYLNGAKEINTLSREFNHMLTEINTLNTQLFETTTHLYEIELAKTKAEIAHLRSQINPHFLYNTLESIRGMALEHHMLPIADMCFNMGKIFHYSIKGNALVPLSEEVSIVKSYLTIQSTRFNERFEALYSINPDTTKLLVPKMILQPLIENAIFHGIEPNVEVGMIYIGTLALPDHTLRIIIQDNGVGMSKNTLTSLQNALLAIGNTTSDSPNHIGILNVHNRIRLLYGEPYGLQIESQVSIGTKITLSLPINHV